MGILFDIDKLAILSQHATFYRRFPYSHVTLVRNNCDADVLPELVRFTKGNWFSRSSQANDKYTRIISRRETRYIIKQYYSSVIC